MNQDQPQVICIIGRKNSGKTELTVSLAAELKRRGHRVMTVKHGHGFQLDQAGRDSWRHRHEGGAIRTVLASPRDFAVVGDWPEGEMSLPELVRRFLWDADLVLAEGFKSTPEPKIEVFRGEEHAEPLSQPGDPLAGNTLALVTDHSSSGGLVPVFSFRDPDYLSSLADLVEDFMSKAR